MTRQEGSDIILERMMTLHPKVMDLSLDRMWDLLAKFSHPERNLPPVIHIAGTNGKGSTQAMIRAGLEQAGHRVHAYTSPHLARFHERIRISGELISEPVLVDMLNECLKVNDGADITFFEITTIAALLAFSRYPADYTLLEVGLGGRLDTTNVIAPPALTVITPVSIDHQQYLGETLGEIAGEKAGILKQNVPCIVAPQQDAALDVIEAKAERLTAPLFVHGQHWHVSEERNRLIFQDETGLLDLPLPALIGAHQVQNAGTAIAALRHFGLDSDACDAAMSNATWPARLQRLRHGPLVEAAGNAEVWLDGGHNAAAGSALAEAVTRLSNRPLHLICGMLNTKDATGFMRPLRQVAETLNAVTLPGENAMLSAQEIDDFARSVGFNSQISNTALQAVKDITAQSPNGRILICGALYLAGDILKDNG